MEIRINRSDKLTFVLDYGNYHDMWLLMKMGVEKSIRIVRGSITLTTEREDYIDFLTLLGDDGNRIQLYNYCDFLKILLDETGV